MKGEAPLDSVVFQLDESRTRCELWVSAQESTERLASGYLMPFLSHLSTAREQLGDDCGAIKLYRPHQSAFWFTKRTIERFVRFVSTPDVLERVGLLEAERMKLAEASSILISESPEVLTSVLESGNPGNHKAVQANAQAQAEEHSMDTLEMETESSRRHLVKAMDARRLILEKEQRNAFARAAAAGFTIECLPDLIAFAESFGAARLREACSTFGDLHRKLLDTSQLTGDRDSSTETPTSGMAEEKVEVEVVKNFGRRRVWGPPVSEIPIQNGRVPEFEEPDCNASAALTSEDSGSPQKSTASRESDWEDKEGNVENPVYENVLGQLTSNDDDNEETEEGLRINQVGLSAVRRKGIVVIKNLKFPQGGENSIIAKQSDSESDRDSENETKLGSNGRLSVQAAISLFETKQKKSRDAMRQQEDVDGKASDRSRTGKPDAGHRQVDTAKERQASSVNGSMHIGNLPPIGDRDVTLRKASIDSKKVEVAAPRKKENEQIDQVQQRPGKEGLLRPNTTAKTADDIRKELVHRTQKRAGASIPNTLKSADDISKELLDRSYTCLLKINSVVQDALFSASALRQSRRTEGSMTNGEADPNTTPWRSLSNVSNSLDNIFVENRVPKEASRRQSLCSPAELAGQGQGDKVPVALGENQKGRFYDQYQEIRAAKYKKESTHTRAERESKLRAMQDVLERRKIELLGRSSRLPEKNNTLTVEQIKAMKLQAVKNSGRKEVRPDPRSESMRSLQNEKSGARTRTSNVLRNKQDSSPSSTNSNSSTRKTSPGFLKPPTATPRNVGRLSTSPRSKYSPTGPPVSQRRPNFMSQSVISESLRTQPDLRKENAKPFTGRNSLNTTYETGQPSKHFHSQVNKVNRNLTLETSDTNSKRLGRKERMDSQIPAPPKVCRDQPATENSKIKYDMSTSQGLPRLATPRPSKLATSKASALEVLEVKDESGSIVTPMISTPISLTKSSDECIKQIVSCTSKDRNDGHSSPLPTEVTQVSLLIKTSESFKDEAKPEEEPVHASGKQHFDALVSTTSFDDGGGNDDDDMQIDEALEKCMSGRSFLKGISASPLTTYETATPAKTREICCNYPQESFVNSSLRTGPSSQSLPHLPRSLSPSTVASFRNDFAAKEIKSLCKEHHQNKEQPKGLKRLLKFGRRSRGSDSNVAEWSTVNDDFAVQGVGSSKKNPGGEEMLPRASGSSGVRRSLEALPKIADAASEISARNFFSSFRSKSSAGEPRSRA